MTSITVAIPVYYKCEWEDLKNCLISINNQIVKPDEIIIVVNGFNKKFINKKKFCNFVMTFVNNIQTNIFFREEASIALALNECIRKSKCDWICRIDCDDRMLKNRIKEFYFYKSNYHNKKIWLFYSQVITLEKENFGGIWKTCHPNFLGFQLSIKNPILHTSVFFKKSVVLDLGGYRDYRRVEDYDLWLRLFKLAKETKNKEAFLRINKPLVAYSIDLSDAKESLSLKSIDAKSIYQKDHLNLMPFPLITLIFLIPLNLLSKIRQISRPYSYRILTFFSNHISKIKNLK